ncbi:signal peptidase I [Salininema proteolyticum]|uniref:Signal peptidase I n=1 Tax=Salininema proteolyticum TaxID=1607685 RepID=A0ABV8TZ69_9ACTN
MWKEIPILLGIAIVVAIVVRSFVMQTYFIPSGSMEHTLDIDDRVLVNKLVYLFDEPDRGEVIVFHAPDSWKTFPGNGDEEFIKRVIATGGDTVECCDEQGRILVNGQPLDETEYLYTDDATGERDAPSRDKFSVTVPADRLWVMGDHRSDSGDSRESYVRTGDVTQSTIPEDEVVGKAFALFWPFDRARWLSIPDTFDDVPASPPAR